MPYNSPTRTVVVLGVSYGGSRAVRLLADTLSAGWRVVAIDRTSHMNHVYVFPRFIALPELAPKAFIPYTNLFGTKREDDPSPLPTPPRTPTAKHTLIQGEVTSLEPHAVTIKLPKDGDYDASINSERIEFDYCVYALGAGLPAPCDLWGESGVGVTARGSKPGGVKWIAEHGDTVKRAERILVVGAGALGIRESGRPNKLTTEFASDIKDLYPTKEVTLLHSRTRMLPRYEQGLHDAVVHGLEALGVNLVLGERVTSWPEDPEVLGEKTVHTDKGSVFTADLVLACTGQKPHTALMAGLDEHLVNRATGRISVRPTLQVSRCGRVGDVAGGMARMNLDTPAGGESNPLETTESTPLSEPNLDHIFAIGDSADTEAIQAGHTAYYMAEVAVRNIGKLIARESRERRSGVRGGDGSREHGTGGHGAVDAGAENSSALELETYLPTAPMIKVTLGINRYAQAGPEGVITGDDGAEDLQARLMWGMCNAQDMKDED